MNFNLSLIRSKFKNKLLGYLIISSLTPAAALLIVTYYISLQSLDEHFALKIESVATDVAEKVESWKLRSTSLIKLLAKELEHRDLNQNQKKDLFKNVIEANPSIYAIHTLNTKGFNSSRSDNIKYTDYSNREYFKQALAGRLFTEGVLSKTFNKAAICTSAPIYKHKKIIEVIAICSFIDQITREIGTIEIGKTGYVFLIDEMGRALAHPKIPFLHFFDDTNEYYPIGAFRQGQRNKYEFQNMNKKYISFLIPISDNWAVIALQAKSEILAMAQENLATPLAIGILFVAIGVILTYIAVDRSTKPLNNLATELKEKVAEQSQQLLYSAKMSSLGEMAGSIAHEINNPLAIINLQIDSLKNNIEKKPFSTELILETLNRMEHTAFRITKIIRGLRTFSRDGSKDAMRNENLLTILADTQSLIIESLKKQNIEFRINCPPHLELECQPVPLSQVFVNLIMNSKHAIENNPQKWISIVATETIDKIFIRVTDSGNGISLDVQQKIMHPFFTTKPIGQGTGLGLSISKGIIEQHYGKIWYNLDSQNTEFCIVLPKKQDAITSAKPADLSSNINSSL